MWSAIICIALPTLVATLYYLFIAADQYSSEGRFAVRTSEATPVSANSTRSWRASASPPPRRPPPDSYIVVEYLQSRRLVEDLQARLDLRKIYSNPMATGTPGSIQT